MYLADTVKFYDEIYSRMKNYEEEASTVREWIQKIRPHAKTLLDVACGTAEHAKYLKKNYIIDGLDLGADFLEIAKAKNPECSYHQGDMKDFQLNKKFDVIISLFSSIGYVQTYENLVKALKCFSTHLAPNGLIVVEPWLTPDVWTAGRLKMITIDEPDLKVCRTNVNETRNGMSYFQWHFLIAKAPPFGVKYFTEEHTLGLFSVDQMKAAFSEAGLKVQHDEKGIFGRGLYLAEKA